MTMSKNRYNLPPDVLDELRGRFDTDSQVLAMYAQANEFRSQGRYMEALAVNKKIDEIFANFVASFIKEQKTAVEKITLAESGVTEADAKKVVELIITAFMAMDIIETCVMDSDSVLKRVDKALSLTLFDELGKFMATVKQNFRSLGKVTHYLEYPLWGETVDKQGDMMRQKARSIMRRVEKIEKEKI